MADYLVSGKKGAGKSAFCIGVIREALLEGRRVATNLNLDLSKLVPETSKNVVFRIPDRPDIDDLLLMGRGQEGVLEENNGVLILDETSAFLNSRSWNDKGRKEFLDWLIHSRKHGWDTYFIAQGAEQLDKQVRTTQLEYHIAVKNTGKWPIPFLSPLLRSLFGVKLTFPKYHLGIIKQGLDQHALLIGRRWFRGETVYNAYETQQIFYERDHPNACGPFNYLSHWHLSGRYKGFLQLHKKQIFMVLFAGIFLGSLFTGYSAYDYGTKQVYKPVEIPFDPELKIVGLVQEDLLINAILSDGRTLPVTGKKTEKTGVYFMVAGKWLKYSF